MKSVIKSLLAAAIVAFTANVAQAEPLDTSIRKSSDARRPVPASRLRAAQVPTTTDEARALAIREQAALAAGYDGPVVPRVAKRATTTDEARAEAGYSQAELAARGDVPVARRVAKLPTTTDEARGLY